jgi:formate dehydrogenase subunit delta
MSGTTLDKLVYMANQIAREFSSQQPRAAVDATWDHLWHFWDPRMRKLIVAHWHAGGEGLSEVAKAAVAKFATASEPESQTQATEFTHPGEDETEPMSDAG